MWRVCSAQACEFASSSLLAWCCVSCAGKVPDHASWLEEPDTPGPASEVPQRPPELSSVPQPLQEPLISPGDF